MVSKKWRKEKSLEKLALKLAEEVGEVAREITDHPGLVNSKLKEHKKKLDEELAQVIFIAACMRHRLAGTEDSLIMAKAIKPMSEERWEEIQKIYHKSIKTIRNCLDFENLTFTYHPEADEARREVAALTPDLIREVKRLRANAKD